MRSTDIHQETTGRWPSILMSLGVEERFLRNRHGPCPVCAGKDRYRFDDKNGKGTFYCSVCGAGTGFDLIMKLEGIDFAAALKRVRSVLPQSVVASKKTKTRSDAQTKRILLEIWKEAAPITADDEAGKYLQSRGFSELPKGKSLRLHPALEYRDEKANVVGKFPCMLAAILDKTGKCVALHRTWLKDGKKAPVSQPKKSLGAFNADSAIQLYKPTHTLGVAEGIETAIAAHLRFKFPVWSLVSASQMERFQWPSTIKRLLVFGDQDASFTGQKAGYTLAYRAKQKGLDVHITFPTLMGTDWADSFSI